MFAPFFCAVCDEPIAPSSSRKHNLVHDKCIDKYLRLYSKANIKKYNKSTTTNKSKK